MAQKLEHRQHPLGSGFTPWTTIDDVLAGVDLTGTNVIVTAGHAGLGLVTTRGLAGAGASVTVGTRDPARATATTLAGLARVEAVRLDLLDPASIEAFAAGFVDSGRPLHVLINCAGVPAPAELVRDARGYEVQFATNHLGHFQLTLALLPALRAANGARVVNVTSGAQRVSDILWDDINFTSTEYEPHLAYAQSKTANVLFTVELDRRWADAGVRGFAPHPGIVVGTAMGSSAGSELLRALGLIDDSGQAVIDPERGKKTPAQGASTIAFAAVSPLLTGTGGVYLKDCDISALDEDPQPVDFTAENGPAATVVPHSIDPTSARRLWTLSEEMVAN